MSKEKERYDLVIENLENILNNPANVLSQNIREIIETSVRLLKVEFSPLDQYKETLEWKKITKKSKDKLKSGRYWLLTKENDVIMAEWNHVAKGWYGFSNIERDITHYIQIVKPKPKP